MNKKKFYLNKIDFGLSISGYQNQPPVNVNGKPPVYNNQTDRQQIYSLDDYPEKKISQSSVAKPPSDFRMYDATNSDYINEYYQDDKDVTLPSLEKPKFKPTNATQ